MISLLDWPVNIEHTKYHVDDQRAQLPVSDSGYPKSEGTRRFVFRSRSKGFHYLCSLIGRSRGELFIVKCNSNAIHFFIMSFQCEHRGEMLWFFAILLIHLEMFQRPYFGSGVLTARYEKRIRSSKHPPSVLVMSIISTNLAKAMAATSPVCPSAMATQVNELRSFS